MPSRLIGSGTLSVVLSNNANSYIIADAIRIAGVPSATMDLNWTGGGLSGPGTATTSAPVTMTRTYNVSGADATSDFVISYYSSTDATFGNADDVLLGSETITAPADKTVGTHSRSSPNLQFGSGGTYYVFAQLDSA